MPNPSLDAFELAVVTGDREAAAAQLMAILKSIDDRYGGMDAISAFSTTPERRAEQIATRFAAAFGRMVTDPSYFFTPVVYEQLAAQHRWIDLMFQIGGFGSGDYLVPLLATGEPGARVVPPQNVARFLLIFSATAGMGMSFDECLRVDPAATIAAFLGYLGTRFCYSDGAHALREQLLEWLPGNLGQVQLGAVALQNIASPYMHCSYAMTSAKHAYKAALIAQMRRACLASGVPEMTAPPAPSDKPTIVVTTENFNEGHSVYRTHSRAVAALRGAFKVVGVVNKVQLSPAVEACFDEVLTWEPAPFLETVKIAAQAIVERAPAMVLHLGVGMSPHVIALASLRLAPVQAASFGHTATTMSPFVDYMILPDDFVGDPGCFCEELAPVPPAAMPYQPRDDVDYAAVRERAATVRAAARARGEPVRIAVPASVMKLGPPFFDALAAVTVAASVPVVFEIFPLGSQGIAHEALKLTLARRLPTAVVHPEVIYPAYIERLAVCDFFVCPFPYGNMNSIIDAVLVGLPGVCLDGPEAHAHADVAYFRRMGFPAELATSSVDEYVAMIARLASDPAWLDHCRAAAAAVDLGAAFFTGDEQLFVDAVRELIARPAAALAQAS
jgi:hypothetical protein